IIDEYIQNQKIVSDATSNLEEAMKYVVQNDPKKPPTDPDDKKKKETPLQKEQKSYDKQYAELGAELEIGKITQAEYNKDLGELNIKMYAQAKGTGNKEVLESKYFEGLKEAAEKAIKNQDKSAALVEFEKVQKDFNDKVKESQSQHRKGIISQRTLNTNISDLSLEAAKSVASIKGIGDSADGFIGAMILQANTLKAPITARMKKRDTTYDYKKNASDIAEENYNLAKDYAGELKTQLSDKIGDMMDELNRAMDDADFAEALKIAEAIDGTEKLRDAIKQVDTSSKKLTFETLKKDVKDLKKEMNESLYSGIKDMASSSDRVVSAFRNLNEVMSDVDSSGWERIMAIWNTMTNVVDSFLSIIKTIETITELTNKLTKAKEVEAAIDTATTATKVTNTATEATAEVTALGTQTAAELLASSAKTTAATTEMAAKSTAAYAYIPFGGVGLAAAQIATMQALIAAAAIPKFAGGGVITGGPTFGDKILARVNAGEMILNKGQQANLFNALDSGNFGRSSNSNVTIGFDRVLGSDIYLSLKNYMKSTGKKL
ncbi:MAG: phage tail tape measure protein, partial [Bacteroides reticulotermitis]